MTRRWVVISFSLLLLPLNVPAQSHVDDNGFPLPKGARARLGDLHFAQPTTITALALTADGKTIATAGTGIFLWNAATGRIVREMSTPQWITSLAFSKDGKFLAAATHEGTISVWNVATGKLPWQEKGPPSEGHGTITGLRFIGNTRLLAVARVNTATGVTPAQSDTQVQLWDVATGELKQSWHQRGTKNIG